MSAGPDSSYLPDFDSYVDSIRTWLSSEAFRLCGNRHDAEDLVQITLHKIFRRWQRLTDQDQLSAYTRQTLMRTFISERRRLYWKHEVTRAELPDGTGIDRPEVDDRVTLMAAVDQLGKRQRAVIMLRFWDDLSVEQTARALGCTPGTVTSQTHRALRTLRGLLSTGR